MGPSLHTPRSQSRRERNWSPRKSSFQPVGEASVLSAERSADSNWCSTSLWSSARVFSRRYYLQERRIKGGYYLQERRMKHSEPLAFVRCARRRTRRAARAPHARRTRAARCDILLRLGRRQEAPFAGCHLLNVFSGPARETQEVRRDDWPTAEAIAWAPIIRKEVGERGRFSEWVRRFETNKPRWNQDFPRLHHRSISLSTALASSTQPPVIYCFLIW